MIIPDRAESSERDTAIFLVKGLAIGQTSVSAVVLDKTGKKMASAPQPVEVSLRGSHRVIIGHED